jgi:DNA-binding MarR family transcriptional regulator
MLVTAALTTVLAGRLGGLVQFWGERRTIQFENAVLILVFAGYALSTYVDWKTFECYPAQDKIGADIGVTGRSAHKAIKELEQTNWIVTRRRPRTSKVYRLNIPDRQKSAAHGSGDERKKASVHEGSHERKKASAHEASDNPSDRAMSDSMNGSFGSDERKFCVPMNGRILPPNDIREQYKVTTQAPSRRQRATSAQADAAPTPREPASVAQYPASPFPKDSSLSSDGSLTRLMARSPSEEDSQNGNITPLAGKEIPQTSRETRSGAASLLAADDWPDDDCDMSADDEERLLAKERREEARDDEIIRQRNAHTSAEDDLDANLQF